MKKKFKFQELDEQLKKVRDFLVRRMKEENIDGLDEFGELSGIIIQPIERDGEIVKHTYFFNDEVINAEVKEFINNELEKYHKNLKP